MKKGLTVLLIFLLLLVLVAGAGLFAGYKISNSDTNLKNVFIGEIDVSGLTREQTTELLNSNGWRERAETPLTVTTLGGNSFDIDRVESGMIMSVEDSVRAAFNYGHDSGLVSGLITAVKTYLSPVDISAMSREPDTDYIDSCIDSGIAEVIAYMGEEEYTVDKTAAEMTMKKGWNQISFDKEAFRSAVIEAFEAGQNELSYTTLAEEPKSPDFEAVRKELESDPADAYYKDDGSFDVVDEIVGIRFDSSEAKKIWNAAKAGDEIKIPIDVTWPEITGEELRGRLYHDLLGACMTKFPNSAESRRNNLQLATSKLDGLIIYPGETFSYNETVGERTEEAGFLPAPAYVDGDVKDEIGGGACQVSSTLYAATAFAFLETVEREAHVFPVNYMQMGTDATVTIPAEGRAIDFKFRNNKTYPIKLVGQFDNENSTLSFEIWGTLDEEDYMPVEFDNSYSWTYDYDRYIDPAYPDRTGYIIKLTHETYMFEDDNGSGYRTLTHRQVIDPDGNMIVDDIINAKLENGNFAMDTYYQHP